MVPFRAGVDDGAPGTTRTCDPLIRSQVLYPAELRVRGLQFKVSSFRFQVRPKPVSSFRLILPSWVVNDGDEPLQNLKP